MPVKLSVAKGVIIKGDGKGFARPEILRRARAMLACVQMEKHELSIVLTDENQIQELNKNYRGKDRPTDVLAFAMREGDFSQLAGELLGDVIISVPTARNQAIQHRRDALAEVTMLLAHGLLHLLGWVHDTAAKDKRMRAETDRLCAAASKPLPRKQTRRPRK